MEAIPATPFTRREQILEETLGLIRRVRVRSNSANDGPEGHFGLNSIHHAALHFTMRNPGAIQRDLADFLGVQPGHVSEVVDALERQGLITRVLDPADRRIHRLEATLRAHEFHQRIHELSGESVHPLFRRWTDSEIEALYALLKRLAEEDDVPAAPGASHVVHRAARVAISEGSAGAND